MSTDQRFCRAFGVLSLVTAIPIAAEGTKAAWAFVLTGRTTFSIIARIVLSGVGGVAGFLLLAAGFALCARQRMGFRMAYWACAISATSCTVGVLIGLVGGHGALAGVGLPVGILLLLRAMKTPDQLQLTSDAQSSSGTREGSVHLRSVTV